jgi:hypothetical protein
MTSRNLAVVLMLCSLVPAQTTSMPGQEQDPGQAQNPGQTQNPPANPGANQTAGGGAGTEADQENASPVEPEHESRAQVPLPLNIDASSLQFPQELAHTNYLQGGVNVGAYYDDNLLSQQSPQLGGFTYSILPNLGVAVSRPRLLLNFDYAGGYTINQRFSSYNQSSHDGEVNVRYRVSPHVNFRVYNRFVWTTGFFAQQNLAGAAGGGVIQQPNLGVITPLARHADEFATVELTYQYSAGDMVGMSGTFHDSSFGAPPTGASALIDTRSEEGDAFYTHRFTPRNWSGLAYTYEHLAFNPAIETVDSHDFLLFHSIYLKPKMQLALFAGPEYSQLSSQIVTTSVGLPQVTVTSVAASRDWWTVSGGASFSWQGQHTTVRASAVRKVSDGGGLLTATVLTSGSGALRRQLSRNSSLEFGVLYGNSQAVDSGTTAFNLIKTASGNLQWEQSIGRSFIATFGYAREYQLENGLGIPSVDVNHNRGWITLGYRFTRPLGR